MSNKVPSKGPDKATILKTFDPSQVGLENGNIFGFPFDYDTADIVVFGVPWEVTVSFHSGTAQGPQSVLQASPQLDFYDLDHPDGWKQGIYMPPVPDWIGQQNLALRSRAATVIQALESGQPTPADALAEVNQGGQRLNDWLRQQTRAALKQGKTVAVIGGDHSVPLGCLQALAEQYPEFGILHIDAHCDLRDRYQGFRFSHASIMHNALEIPQISKLVQVGIRDVSQVEIDAIAAANGRVVTHFDSHLKQARYAGTPWLQLCQQIVSDLPQQVYISCDVDGLDPKLCPGTGTPVPGGLELEEAFCLFREVVKRDRQIIGFDLCEVGNSDWDGNVGARIVYKLCNLIGYPNRVEQ
ncbi:agmatinase family protein [Romeria aff. gracilis LEGE 07310]|uniref:Agmatinase family protein n=1 Tax=Vasconcelosia minhoensis LEGE 07310 TaxID=915328 RepID=A0A8J7AY02_9CYAN|nr:agmatinase family protein [Romeria gracilis]MBE9078207.1 agmatinase family protein [Romeria aff. gracilis LEGE 07310]